MKKMVLIFFSLVGSLSVTGIAYSLWVQSLDVSVSVSTGQFSAQFVNGSFSQTDTGSDWVAGTGMASPHVMSPAGNIGSATGAFVQHGGRYDTLSLAFTNVYPSYYDAVNWTVQNNGTIPLKITGATLHYYGNGLDYTVPTNGTVLKVPATSSVFEIKWKVNHVNEVIAPTGTVPQQMEFHVLSGAQQSTTYLFDITMVAEQSTAP